MPIICEHEFPPELKAGAPPASPIRTLEICCLIVTAALAILSFAGSYFVLPYRVSANEADVVILKKALADSESARIVDRELLVRIEEDVIQLSKTVERMDKKI